MHKPACLLCARRSHAGENYQSLSAFSDKSSDHVECMFTIQLHYNSQSSIICKLFGIIIGYCLKHTITETLSIQAKFPQALSCDINFFTAALARP